MPLPLPLPNPSPAPLPLPLPAGPADGAPLPLPLPQPAPEPLPLPLSTPEPEPEPEPEPADRDGRPSLERANHARTLARETRARALVALAQHECTLPDLIDRARDPNGAVYQRITITQCLTATGHKPAVIKRVCARLRALDPNLASNRALTLAWLLDARTAGRRIAVLQDALAPRTSPWPGYPWAPDPTPQRPLGLVTNERGQLV